MWFRISGLMNADWRTQHAEHCGVESGDVWYDWAASGNIKRSMLYHSVETALDIFHTQKEINNSSQ